LTHCTLKINQKNMDNIETTEPVGVEGATSSQDNSAADTQPTESTDSVSDGEVEEEGQAPQPWDNDHRFKGKTPEEMFAIVQEADKYKGELGQKAKAFDLIGQKYGITPQQLEEQIRQQELREQQERYAGNPLAPVLDKVATLEQKLLVKEQQEALNSVKSELDNYIKDNPAYEAHKEQILKLAITAGIGFDQVTGETRSMDDIATEYFGKARAQGQKDAYKKIDTKIMTQSSGVKTTPKKSVSIDDLRNMPPSERIKAMEIMYS
jgi:hypothetical protein